MPVPDALQRVRVALPPVLEELARLALRYVEMGPIRQPA